MAKTILGKVGMTPKGNYSNTTNYVRLDVVTVNGSSYVCLKDCVGKDVTDTEYWQLIAEKGDKGDKPKNGVDYNTDAEKTEFKNEVVTETKTDIADYVTEQKTELSTHTETKKSELDEYESTKETELNTKATELTNAFNTNATSKTKDYNDNATAKTTDFDNNATEKITAYNDNATTKTNEFNENVDSLNNKITKLENENDDLYNALYTEKTNGTEIYIDDAKKCRLVNTEIDGKYKQDGTTGKQLLNVNLDTTTKNGITLTRNADGTYTANGTATATAFFVIGTFNFAANTNYILNGCPAGGAITTYQILLADTANAYDAGNGYNCNFEEDTVKNIAIRIQNGVTVNNIVFKPMISSTGGDYEKYTGSIASPNPNYPQEIEQIEEIKYCETGKNCYDILKFNANTTIGSFKGQWIYLKPNTKYTISTNMVTNPDGSLAPMVGRPTLSVAYITVTTDTAATKLDSAINGIGMLNSESRTVLTNKTGAIFVGYRAGQASISTMQKKGGYIQIEEGTVATEHEEYKEQIINIDLKGNKLCAVSDVIKDKLLIDRNGNVALQKNVEYVKFTSKDGWQTNGSTDARHGYITPVLNILPNTIEKNCISNIAMISGTTNSNTNAVLAGTTAMSKLRLYIPKKFLNTELSQLEALNELLQKTPMEIYYELATPEIIDLGQIDEIPSTFEGTNNIWVETNLGNTEIEIEYVQDVKKLIEQTQAMIINNASEEVTE